jgi:hypothetical protein
MSLVPGYYESREAQDIGSSMNNPRIFFVKYGGRALSISSVICLLVFTGCAGTDGAAENHTVTSNAVTRHVRQGQGDPEEQIVGAEPDYGWFY